MIPRVSDLSHHNEVIDFRQTAAAGIWGIIHKASEGTSFVDERYATRRNGCLSAGMLWGAYHFNNGSDVTAQIDHFVKTAAPDKTTLMVLDYEDHPQGNNMSIHQAVEFMHQLEQAIGREAAIYSGNRLKETIGQLSQTDHDYLTSRRLWLAQYGSNAVVPAGYSKYWLWQYTGDGIGPEPHEVAGIKGTGIDLNVVYGDTTQSQLVAEWPGKGISPMVDVPVVPTVPAQIQDPIPQIIAFLEGIKKFLPFISGLPFVPPAVSVGANAAIPIIEEVLKLIESFKTKSGVDLFQTIGQHIQTIGSQVQTATTKVAQAPPTSSEGMPNS